MNAIAETTVPAITVRREIAVPAGELFDAWLDPELLAAWMRPGSFPNSIVRNDPREGGAFEIRMQGPNGEIPHRGVYRTIDRPRRLVFTWISVHTLERETLVTVDFHARGKSTEIVLKHELFPDAEAARKHEGGWTQILENLGGAGNAAAAPSCGTSAA